MFGRNPDAVVPHFKGDFVAPSPGRQQYATAWRGIAQRIGQQVGDHPFQHNRIGFDPERGGANAQGHVAVGRCPTKGIGEALKDRLQRRGARLRLDAGHIES
ncbi:hypothetical protein SDC9_160964 [bioreactor metagenome]|uniref:Uncharacterized protein n=1 Tax=bioreactor metagenome TaxID=1076179 RepID=A0A645FGY7_9ZZZZ